jgi:hypothetical protein
MYLCTYSDLMVHAFYTSHNFFIATTERSKYPYILTLVPYLFSIHQNKIRHIFSEFTLKFCLVLCHTKFCFVLSEFTIPLLNEFVTLHICEFAQDLWRYFVNSPFHFLTNLSPYIFANSLKIYEGILNVMFDNISMNFIVMSFSSYIPSWFTLFY